MDQDRRHASHQRIRLAMIVSLAAVTVLIGVSVLAELRIRAHRAARLGPQPPSLATRLPVDDVYTKWFNANSRCDLALRAWREAVPAARRAAYRAYVAELELEAAAAAELELHATPLAA